MWYDLSKKNRGAQNHSNEPRTNPPSGVSKCMEFYLACTGGVETKKNAGPNKVRPWRAPKIPVERNLNTVFIFAPQVTIHGRFPRSGCPPPPQPEHAPLYWLASYQIPRSAEARIILILCPAFWLRRWLFSKNNPQFSRSAALSVCVEVRGAWMSGMNPYV